MSQPAPLRILISGAGIAGPAVALCLARFGVAADVTIVERHHELRANGQQIDLRGQGLEAMKRMGIEEATRERVVDEKGLVLVNRRGERAVVFAKEEQTEGVEGQKRQGFSAEWEIMRGDLCKVLYDATKGLAGVSYRFGAGVQSYESGMDKVHVRFTDGAMEDYDLVVGADGVGSKIRRLMFGEDDKNNLRRFGLFSSFYTIPPAEADTREATVCCLPGRRNILTRKDREDCLRVYLGYVGDDPKLSSALKHGTMQEQKRAWAERFADEQDSWQVKRFLDGLVNSDEASDFYTQEVVQIRTDVWSQGRVTLVGDAGYCPSPFTGMGTSVAMAGAYVLAGEIARHCHGEAGSKGIPAALQAYEATFRPFVRDVQNVPIKWMLRLFVPESIWAIRFLRWILWIGTVLRIGKLLALLAPGDDQGSWRLPAYKTQDELDC